MNDIINLDVRFQFANREYDAAKIKSAHAWGRVLAGLPLLAMSTASLPLFGSESLFSFLLAFGGGALAVAGGTLSSLAALRKTAACFMASRNLRKLESEVIKGCRTASDPKKCLEIAEQSIDEPEILNCRFEIESQRFFRTKMPWAAVTLPLAFLGVWGSEGIANLGEAGWHVFASMSYAATVATYTASAYLLGKAAYFANRNHATRVALTRSAKFLLRARRAYTLKSNCTLSAKYENKNNGAPETRESIEKTNGADHDCATASAPCSTFAGSVANAKKAGSKYGRRPAPGRCIQDFTL